MFKARKYKELESKLGYKFKSQVLIARALTHASVRGGKIKTSDNERLEFLGDRVLGLAIAGMLNAEYPAANEGELARRYNRLVRGETCTRIARDLDIGNLLILSESEAEGGGRLKDNILADAMEAILGAVYLDGGFEKASAVVLRLWHLEHVQTQPKVSTDAKSTLQEWAQGRGLSLPQYVVIERMGPDHAPQFTAEVRISGLAAGRGQGASKRVAEQAAAANLLEREGILKGSANV